VKNILIVVPSIPAFDRNAGDYRNSRIAEFFSKKYKVFLYSVISGPENEYSRKLREAGIEITNEINRAFIEKNKIRKIIYEYCHTTSFNYLEVVKKYGAVETIIDVHCLCSVENERLNLPASDLKKLKDIEKELLKRADRIICVTEREKQIVSNSFKLKAEVIPTGIDFPDEIRGRSGRKNILYTGCMSNLQNEDAVVYYVDEIFPLLKKEIPSVKFIIAGSNPTKKVKSLACENVVVTGYVPDIQVYYSSSLVSVVPLRIGAGMKSKIIESMAWGCPVVSSSVGAEGMGFSDKKDILIEDHPENFAKAVCALIKDKNLWDSISLNGYNSALKKYNCKKMEKDLLKYV